MFGSGAQNAKPIQISVGTMEDANAQAIEHTFSGGDEIKGVSFLPQAIQDGKVLAYFPTYPMNEDSIPQEDSAFALIVVGKHLGAEKAGTTNGWYIDAETILPQNEQAADYLGTVRHEMGHALGIAAQFSCEEDEEDEEEPKKDIDGNILYRFGGSADENYWNAHLIDQNGNHAQPNMEIITSAEYERRKVQNPALNASDFFIVDNKNDDAPDADLPTAGKVYFVGENVSEALSGATFDGVDGLLVNTREGQEMELSHLQTAERMSHLPYSNYTSFMEAELAVMEDLG